MTTEGRELIGGPFLEIWEPILAARKGLNHDAKDR
jgi:hypothetical protein